MSASAWIVVGAVLWVVVAVPLAGVIGAIVRERDTQVPEAPASPEPAPAGGLQEGAGDGARTRRARRPFL